MVESAVESSKVVAFSVDKDMATQRIKVLLDQLREELERGCDVLCFLLLLFPSKVTFTLDGLTVHGRHLR